VTEGGQSSLPGGKNVNSGWFFVREIFVDKRMIGVYIFSILDQAKEVLLSFIPIHKSLIQPDGVHYPI
jgi:hypothetical protein